jgi:PPOX class probable F420-dependent enzyme
VRFLITPIGGPDSEFAFAIASREPASSLSSLAPVYRELLNEAKYVTLGMTDAAGRVQLTPMWFRIAPDGEHFEINTVKGRAKDGHMRRDGRVTIQVTNPENPYHWVTIYGRVAEIIEESDPERGHLATESIDSLSERGIGQRPYPMRSNGEERVLFLIAPTQLATFGAP